jgi:hypothetical protein
MIIGRRLYHNMIHCQYRKPAASYTLASFRQSPQRVGQSAWRLEDTVGGEFAPDRIATRRIQPSSIAQAIAARLIAARLAISALVAEAAVRTAK